MASPRETQSAGGVVVNPDGHVLVVSQRGTSWSLPKGHVDNGEDLLDAARREIWEESGIRKLKLLRAFDGYQRYAIDKDGGEDRSELKTIHMFLFATTETRLKPLDDHNPEARWVKKEDVEALLTHPGDKRFFLSVLDEL